MKSLKTVISVILLTFFINSCSLLALEFGETEIVNGNKGEALDEFFTKLEFFGFGGQLLIKNEGEIILQKAYGYAGRSEGRKSDLATVYSVASLGKQFTATAILKLEQDGKLSIDDTIDKYFDNLAEDKKAITILNLLTHSSGLPYHVDSNFTEEGITREELERRIVHLNLLFEPGTSSSYSNPGYNLLGLIIEKQSGKSFQEYLIEELFEPAGMENTHFNSPSLDVVGAHSYSDNIDHGDASKQPFFLKSLGAGGQLSTVEDLNKWEKALNENLIINEEQSKKLITPFLRNEALGWRVFETGRGTKVVLHPGDFQGFNVEFRRYVDESRTIILLSNIRENANGYRRVLMNLIGQYLEGETELPEIPDLYPAKDLNIDIEDYQFHSSDYKVIREKDALYLTPQTEKGLALFSSIQDEERLDLLNRQASEVLKRLENQEFNETSKYLNRNLTVPAVENIWRTSMNIFEEELGRKRNQELIGTYISDEMMSFSYFKLEFEKGSKTGTLVWFRDKLIAYHFGTDYPLYKKLGFDQFGNLFNYSVFNNDLIKISFAGGTPKITVTKE